MPAVLPRVEIDETRLPPPADRWFLDVPAIAQLRRDGMDLDPRVTVLVGENGSGKSTFVEALAHSWGDSLRSQVSHWNPPRSAEDSLLFTALRLDAPFPRPAGGCFLRAEAMHSSFARIDEGANRAFGGSLNVRSHGESFLAFLESRLDERGLFVLDEPEAALSFTSCLRLLAIMGAAADGGSQVVLATHSPVLAAFPGATIIEFGTDGFTRAEWDDLELTTHWRAFLDSPQGYLRHLFPVEGPSGE